MRAPCTTRTASSETVRTRRFSAIANFWSPCACRPAARLTWRDFAAWFARLRDGFRDVDAHQAFEEMRGVIDAEAGGVLSRDAYVIVECRRPRGRATPNP
jgi:hypothetical protein